MINDLQRVPGSFRDPAGCVYEGDNRIFRTVNECFIQEFDQVRASGLLEQLAKRQYVLPAKLMNPDREVLQTTGPETTYVLEIPKLPFISYPYEWTFSALKSAALLHLDIHLTALSQGMTLSDASAYNIQFQGAKPIFIDHLSFRPYKKGEVWAGHRQFCEQFLNPLLLQACLGVSYNAWYRGTQEGIRVNDLARLLKWRHVFRGNMFMHVVLQATFQKASQKNALVVKKDTLAAVPFSLLSFQRMLAKLQKWISQLEPESNRKTVWQDYTKQHSYSSEETTLKKEFVREFSRETRPQLLWDLGCNSGEFSATALEDGAEYVVGFDVDHGALEAAFARAQTENLPFQAVYMDALNPAPNQGWMERERESLQSRAKADGVLALAFVHHLAIARNVPLEQVLDWIMGLAPSGVIEFVPKEDPMVDTLLRLREDIFPNYTERNFRECIARNALIVKAQVVSKSGRLLIEYTRL
jgi:ribosomal protein L11 methylase PrmA